MLCSLLAVASLGLSPAVADPAQELAEYLAACERFGFSGSVLVARKGEVLLAEGYGLADREEGTPNTAETCFEIASATKPFTAVAVLQLAAEGELDLDESIAAHLPGVPEDKRGITVRHLLMHTSGMPRSAAGAQGSDLAAATARYLRMPLSRAPGEAHEYWNGGYALLAGVVEEVSGSSYMSWCRDHVFEPAGMESSGFTGDRRFRKLAVAVGYEEGQPPRRADEHPYGTYGWQYRGMGGLVTNAADLLRFHEALRDDTLLPEEWRATLLAPGDGSYACGFYVLDEPRPVITHGGDVRGFHTKFSFYPEDDAAIVVMCNVSGVPTWTVTENLQAILFGDRSRYPQPPRPEPWKAKDLADLAGTWSMAPDESLEVRVEGDALEVLAVGVEATELLRPPSLRPPGQPRPDPPSPELVAHAFAIAEAVAAGDPEPLRETMMARIPARWPDDMIGTYWPAHVETWGALEGIRVAGGQAAGEVTTVLLALDHERGSPRLKIVFQGDRLRIFDLKGPEALARVRVVPDGKRRLIGFRWTGPQPEPIELIRKGSGPVRGLRLAGGEKFLRD